ncbi:hypothetical protein CRENBAI_021722 [Crenichthys baileyi]|uniref:Uncharacterized protein n=1 Tax=Crenichthys baileyi TaxID=28760 RepID=A0AAV9QWT4_9TELE
MAAPGENLLSVEHLNCMEQNTFAKQKELFIKESRGMQLQQHLQELKKREHSARQHNRQLLLQFERAQDTLKEMLAHNAAMKIIRMEYERYLEENIHRWQQQLQERKQASQKKFFPQQRMEDSLKPYLQINKHEVSTGTLDEPLISQDPSIRSPKCNAPAYPTEENSAYGQDNSSSYPHPESSWLTQAGMLPGYLRAPFQSQSPSLFPPPNFPYSHPLLLQHITSPLAHHQPWARPKVAGRAPPQYDNPCIDGIPHGSSGQLHTVEPSALRVTQILEEEDETSIVISKRVRSCDGRRCLSSELDVKPVRLSSGHTESSESSRDSSLTSREKKKREKKGRTKPSSSESERCGSQKSSRSEIVAAFCQVALGSEINSSSEEGDKTKSRRTKRGRGLNIGSTPSEKVAGELNRSEEDEKTDSLGEKVRSPGQDNGSETCRGDDGSDSDAIKSENRGEEMADEEVNTSEHEEEGKKNPGSGDEKIENKLKSEDGDVEEDKENNEVSPSRNQKEQEDMEDEEKDEEQSDKLENDDRENRKQDSVSSQNGDEDQSEGSEKIEEDEEGSSEEEDQLRSDEAEDSEDSIIFPQENRSKQMKNTPEEAAEDEEESEAQSSNRSSEESSDEENIENLLAPREPTNKNNYDAERVDSSEFFRGQISDDITRLDNTDRFMKLAQERLNSEEPEENVPPYRHTQHSTELRFTVLMFCMSADQRALQRMVMGAEKVIGVSLHSV